MAHEIIEKLTRRMPYLRRWHERFERPRERLAATEASPHGAQSPNIGDQFRAFLRLLRPHDALHIEKRRFGAENDGGYVMLDDLGRSRTALSLGIGGEVSWDLSMVERGLHVIQFDDALGEPPLHSPAFTFNRARVVGRPERADDVTLARILARSEFAGDNDIIVKIDIEGSEWEVLSASAKETFARMRQITVEFHDLAKFAEDPVWRRTAVTTLHNLAQTHVCIHIHGNNWAPLAVIGGISFPSVFEATFARRSDYTVTPSTATYPTELDRPNNPNVPDLQIGRWTY